MMTGLTPMSEMSPLTEQYIDPKRLAHLLGVSPRTLRRYVQLGVLPRPVRLSNSITRWPVGEVCKRLEELRVQ